jgi:PEP-CTERM motif
MKKVFLVLVVILATSIAAHANALVLTQVIGNLYQQTVQSPCIFSNPSCQNGTFPHTDLDPGGNVTSYDAFSPIYTGSTLLAIIGAGNPMILGIDINQATGAGPQTLTSFFMLKNGVVVDTFAPATLVPAGNNGNGYADYILTNFTSFVAGDTIQFHFVFSGANDGTENVFLIGGTPVVQTPEPSTLLTVLLGLGFLGAAGRNMIRSSRRS